MIAFAFALVVGIVALFCAVAYFNGQADQQRKINKTARIKESRQKRTASTDERPSQGQIARQNKAQGRKAADQANSERQGPPTSDLALSGATSEDSFEIAPTSSPSAEYPQTLNSPHRHAKGPNTQHPTQHTSEYYSARHRQAETPLRPSPDLPNGAYMLSDLPGMVLHAYKQEHKDVPCKDRSKCQRQAHWHSLVREEVDLTV